MIGSCKFVSFGNVELQTSKAWATIKFYTSFGPLMALSVPRLYSVHCNMAVGRQNSGTRRRGSWIPSSARICRRHPVGKRKALSHAEISENIKMEKGLWGGWYSKRAPQAPSTKTNGTSDTFIYSLPSAVPFSKALKGRKSYIVTETRLGPKIASEFASD
jgi:hypothetical protein